MSAQSWQPIDLTVLEHEPAVRPTIQQGLIYPGGRHLISGEPESGKSWLALVASVEQIRAGNAIVWIDREGDARFMLERLDRLGVTPEELARIAYIAPYEPVTVRGVPELITATLEHYRPTLVTFDAFAGLLDLHNLDENKTPDIERGYRLAVEPWRVQGAGTLAIDHVTKGKDNRGRFAIGSQRKLGVVDVHLGLVAVEPFGRGREGKARIYVHKDRSGFLQRPRFGDFVLESDEDGNVVRSEIVPAPDPADFKPTHLMEKVSHHLIAEGECNRKELEKEIGGRGEFVRMAIDALVEEGYIFEGRGARGARVYTSMKAYVEPKEWEPLEDSRGVDEPPEQSEIPW